MQGVGVENKKKGLALLGLGNNIFKNIFIHASWVLNPQKAVDLVNKLQQKLKTDGDETFYVAIAIGYLNEFYSKYIVWGKPAKFAITLNEYIDTHNSSNDKIVDTLIKIRKARLAIKKETKKFGVPEDEYTKGNTVGVSGGIVEGKILNIKNANQKIMTGTIGVFPNAGTTYTNLFKKCVGIIFLKGGITSHGAIIAREFKIPAIISPKLKISDRRKVVLNGSKGIIN